VKNSNRQDGNGHSNLPAFDPQQEAPLLSAYVDGELDPEQVARVEAHLAQSPESRAEVARLRRLQEVTGAMVLKEAPAEEWEKFWSNLYNRVERGLGWLALAFGAVIVGGYGLHQLVLSLLETPDLPWYLKLGIFAICFGVLLLLVSVIRERVFVNKRTRYKDVLR
jgi:hypothetical protein